MGGSPSSQSHQRSHTLNSEPELPDLLLVVKGRESTAHTESKRYRGAPSSLDDARDCRTQDHDTVAQGKLGTVVLVLLDQVTYVKRQSATLGPVNT